MTGEPHLIPGLGPEQHGLGSLLPGMAEGLHDNEFSLLELADRLLNRGVVIAGEATISVAGVDLVYLGLNVVLTAVENLRPENVPPRTG
ncbi:MAG: gas vesicle protein [Chloroflexota bacterium]